MAYSEAQALGVLDAAFDPVLVVDRGGRIAFASKSITALTGFAPDELVGRRMVVLAPARLREALTRYLTHFFAHPEPILIGGAQMLSALRKDGGEIPVELGLSPIDDNTLAITLRDVSQRLAPRAADALAQRRMQERLAAAHETFRMLLEHTPAAVAMLDRDMRYIVASRRWLDAYAPSRRDIVGVSHYELFPNPPERWMTAYRRCLAGETQRADDDWYERPDGAREYLRWELTPWLSETGEIGGLIIFNEIITRRKLAELAVLRSRDVLEAEVAQRTHELLAAKDEAMRANALKSRFVAAVSHDLRQPLHAVALYLASLEEQLDAPEHRDICVKAERAIDGMTGILEALLDVSRLEGGAITPHPTAFAVSEMLTRVAASNLPRAEAKGLTMVQLDTDAIAWSDPMLLERIVDNFVSNAIRYTDAGSIRVGCEAEGETLRIFVADTGIGIPADARERIFEDNVQLANPSRERSKGFGLGLAIAKDIADALGSTLELDSAVGQGSVFAVSAPQATLALAQRG
jgi:PAS domain S-box-containing protein